MNRSDLQKIADIRVEDARVLLDAQRFEAAYYLVAYAVECALKACIAKQIKEFDFPEKKLINDSYSHDLVKLLGLSGVGHLFEAELGTNSGLQNNWAVVKDWSEGRRYDTSVVEKQARDMYDAITESRNGVLSWLKKQW